MPGTSIAAIAGGRKDALLFALGMLAGALACAEFTPGLDDWCKAKARGEMTLPSPTGIGMGWWSRLFIALLAGAGLGMARPERRFRRLRPRADAAGSAARESTVPR